MQAVGVEGEHAYGRLSAARALVVTVVHHPSDSRIRHRQIEALTRFGWDVTYAAPFSAFEAYDNPVAGPGRLFTVDLPRAEGRRRLTALMGARNLLRREGARHDIVLLHDPELVTATIGLQLPPVVLDVHEDTAAAVSMKPWLPSRLRRVAAHSIRRFERFAEQRHHLLLAEHAYAGRFTHRHAVVPNSVSVPEQVAPPDQPRVVYVGHLSRARGTAQMLDLARTVHMATDGQLKLKIIGNADQESAALVRAAEEQGVVEWTGFLPSAQALRAVEGAVAGLSLLLDEPNYRFSMPTKVVEYMARGVPVVTTPLALPKALVEESGCGFVVPFEDARAAADAVLRLWEDRTTRHRMARAGRRVASERFDWSQQSAHFIDTLTEILHGPAGRAFSSP